MARDADAIIQIKYANAGSVGLGGLDLNELWPISYSTVGGLFPQRIQFNQLFRYLSALSVEINQKGPFLEYDNAIDYEVGSMVSLSNIRYSCNIANGPTSSVVNPVGDITGTWIRDFVRLNYYSSLSDAVTQIAALETELWVDVGETISSDVTIPLTLSLRHIMGSILSIDAAKTITINGELKAGFCQIFAGLGDLILGPDACKEVPPEWFGIDGTDDYVEIQKAIDVASTKDRAVPVEGEGKPVALLAKQYNLGATGIELWENAKLIGAGSALEAAGGIYGGSWLIYTGTGNAITIDGAWSGFDARRSIKMEGFSIDITATPTAAIYADFMTVFQIDDVVSQGTPDYHMFLQNCYNGRISGGRLSEATIANMIWTIDVADDVFSGQTLIEDVDFWDAQNGTSDAAGVILEAPANILEQLVFLKCHFKSNDYGMWVKSGGDKTLLGCHFEGNLESDILVDSGGSNPKVIGGKVNNLTTTTTCFDLDGIGGCVKDVDFSTITNSAACITVGPNAESVTIADVKLRRNTGNTMNGIIVEGEDTTIKGVLAITGGVAAAWPVITIEATAKNVYISNLATDNFSGAGAVVDNGGENIIFEDAVIVEGPEWTVDGGTQETGFYINQSGYINRAWIIYPQGTAAGTTTAFQIGRSTTPGTTDYTRYASHTTATSAAVYEKTAITISGTPAIAASDVLLLKTNGTSSTAGSARLIVEITPYRALS